MSILQLGKRQRHWEAVAEPDVFADGQGEGCHGTLLLREAHTGRRRREESGILQTRTPRVVRGTGNALVSQLPAERARAVPRCSLY